MSRKNIIRIITVISILLTILSIFYTYAIFESNVEAKIEVQKAKWTIHINNTDISSGENIKFNIDQIDVIGNNRTTEGKLAPGQNGKFYIEIDPTNTEVSVRYDITFDLSKLAGTKIEITSIKETEAENMFIKTGENTYTGIIPLQDIKSGIKNNITVEVTWYEDETTNVQDSLMGGIYDNKISIPIELKITQYLGEKIEEYNK